MNWKNLVLGATACALITACGGGGGNDSSSPAYNVSGNSAFGNGSSGSSGSTSGSTTNTDVSSNASGTVVLSLSSSTISASQPATITTVVKDAQGAPIAGALVQFTLSGAGASSLATLSPESSLTDANGQAVTTLTPSSGATSGAAYVNASADTAAGTLTAKRAFSVSATNVSLGTPTVSDADAHIGGYETTSVSIPVTGASSTTPVTVNVSSTCATAGKASISPASLTITGSSGTVTYQDKGCGSTSGTGSTVDRINVQLVGTSSQGLVDLRVDAPITQGIQFVSVDNSTICEKGTGCPSVANVVFKTVDQTGAAQAGLTVDFTLNNPVATLGSTSGVTGADGTVSVAVAANRMPSPVRVIATVRGSSPVLQTVSNNLTISGGLPVASNSSSHNGITFSASKYSLLQDWHGDYADLTVSLTDRWGAPAIDGTIVNLVADGGTVVPAYCTTLNGSCAVKLVVSNPQPTNGRVHVVAFANAQEYFYDQDGDGVFDNSDTFDDVKAAVCIDRNESRACDASEYVTGNFSLLNAGDGVWNDGGSAFAQIGRTFIFSDTSSSDPRLFKVNASDHSCTNTLVDDAYMTADLHSTTITTIEVCIRDANTAADTFQNPTDLKYGNPLPAGTSIAAASSSSNVSVTISNIPVSVGVNSPTRHVLTVRNISTGGAALTADATATLTFTLPAPGYPQASGGTTPTPVTISQTIFISH